MVADENDATSWLDGRWVEVPQKIPERLSVEPPHFTPKEKSAVAEANGSEVPHALPRETQLDLGPLEESTSGIVILAAGSELHREPRGLPPRLSCIFEVFLCRFCRPASALAKTGRGLHSRKSNRRNSRWHWRTPRGMPYSFSIHAERVLPSHKFTRIPTSLGFPRNGRWMASLCFSSKRRGHLRLDHLVATMFTKRSSLGCGRTQPFSLLSEMRFDRHSNNRLDLSSLGFGFCSRRPIFGPWVKSSCQLILQPL
jgi:hypothetical protein